MTTEKPALSPTDTLLTGSWIADGNGVRSDAVCERIKAVLPSLRKLAVSADGDCTLLQDPADGRYWEHSYPQSEGHGGGAPQLEHISAFYARSFYDLDPQNSVGVEAFRALSASLDRSVKELADGGQAALAATLRERLRRVEWDSRDDLVRDLSERVRAATGDDPTPHQRWILTNLSLSLARFTSPASPGLPTSREP